MTETTLTNHAAVTIAMDAEISRRRAGLLYRQDLIDNCNSWLGFQHYEAQTQAFDFMMDALFGGDHA